MRAPVVVGSWPEPFAQVSAGSDRLPVRSTARPAAAPAARSPSGSPTKGSTRASSARRTPVGRVGPRCGSWLGRGRGCAPTRVAAQLDDGPATSGVFARFERSGGGWTAVALDSRARPARSFAGGAGLVAGLARGTEPPTWVVTGTDETGVDAAIELPRHARPRTPLRRPRLAGRRDRPSRAGVGMRSALAYAPRPGRLRTRRRRLRVASISARWRSSPSSTRTRSCSRRPPPRSRSRGFAPAPAERCAAAARWGAALGVLVVAVNAVAAQRGDTILVRGWHLPVLGQLDVSGEALAEGAIVGLRIAIVFCAFAVHSACVDPDRMLRLLRPLARHSALTATLITRLVPLAAADHARLAEAARLRGPAAAPVGRPALARRLVAGSLDRAVDVAAALELRGYARGVPGHRGAARSSRHCVAVRRRRDRDRRDRDRRPARGRRPRSIPIRRSRSPPAPRRSRSRSSSRRLRPRRSSASGLAMAEPLVHAAGFSYRYPGADSVALDELDLVIAEGEFVVLAGRSGSGQVDAAAGLLRPRSPLPRRRCVGLALGLRPRRARARPGGARRPRRSGRTGPRDAGRLGHGPRRARAAARAAGRAARRPGRGRSRRSRWRSRSSTSSTDRPTPSRAGSCSGSRSPRRWSCVPRLVLLDEPTSQLDPVAGDELIGLLRRLNEEWGMGVVLAEHRLERCLAAADRVLAVDAARVVFDGDSPRLLRLGRGSRAGARAARGPAVLARRGEAAARGRQARAADPRRAPARTAAVAVRRRSRRRPDPAPAAADIRAGSRGPRSLGRARFG